jgi:SAM-dependent methyltransferase
VDEYGPAFFDAHRDGARHSARAIVPLVLRLVRAGSVIDVGCGQGTWLAVFAEHGAADVTGVDGDSVDRDRLEIPADRFRGHDLARPLSVGRTFDLAVSLEVAEHLPAASADDFVASLAHLAPVVLFSAAAPYQGGGTTSTSSGRRTGRSGSRGTRSCRWTASGGGSGRTRRSSGGTPRTRSSTSAATGWTPTPGCRGSTRPPGRRHCPWSTRAGTSSGSSGGSGCAARSRPRRRGEG